VRAAPLAPSAANRRGVPPIVTVALALTVLAAGSVVVLTGMPTPKVACTGPGC
jgi:hypothetical protein